MEKSVEHGMGKANARSDWNPVMGKYPKSKKNGDKPKR